MTELRVGVQLHRFGLPFRKALEAAARTGAQGIELDARSQLVPGELSDTGLRQIRKWIDDFNLRVCAVRFRTRRGYDVLEDLDRRIEATRGALQFAYRMGTPIVVNQVGRVPEGEDDAAWERLVASLSELGRAGQRIGAFVTAETGSESGPDLARLINALPPGSLFVALNPGNLIVQGFSVSDALRSLGSHIAYVYARDAVRDLARGRGVDVPLGRGSVDFPQLLGTLEEFNYRGYFTIDRSDQHPAWDEVRQSVEYLQNLVR